MPSVAICPLPKQTVSFALLTYATKQRANLAPPRHHCELIHGGNHHRWWTMVNLFVNSQYGDAIALGEVASLNWVTTKDLCSTQVLVDLYITARFDF